MEFSIGQIFEGVYPPAAADFCNTRGDCYITELDPAEDDTRRFQIVAVPEPSLEEVKSFKLQELERAFLQWYEKDAVVTSSLGFVADSDVRAVTDVSGLIAVAEASPEESRTTVEFMDHENVPHMLTFEQLKTLHLEILQNGQSAYQQKWSLRTQIEEAQDAGAVESVEIKFNAEDFSATESLTLAKVGV